MSESMADEIKRALKQTMDTLDAGIGDMDIGIGDMDSGDMDLGGDDGSEPASSRENVLNRHFPVQPGSRLTVSNTSGDIRISGQAESEISVHAVTRGSPSRVAGTRVHISNDNNHVRVEASGNTGGILGVVRGIGSVDFTIRVPHDCTVEVKTVSGDVDIQDLRSDTSVQSVSGDVNLRDIEADCSLTTISGDVRIHGLVGELTGRTTSGDLDVQASDVRRFHLNSIRGDMSLETPLARVGHYFAKTVSGDLQLSVPYGTGAMVQLKTTSGDVSSDLPAEIVKSGRRHWQGRINGGGANVEMQSISGDLTMHGTALREPESIKVYQQMEPVMAAESVTEESAPPTPSPVNGELEQTSPATATALDYVPAASDPTAAQGNTTAVLQRLARGEITVEEAMGLMTEGEE